MNRADKMLEAIRDGRVYSRHEIWERAGEFFLTNNAAAELRSRGLNVAYDKKQDTYQLLPLDETPGPKCAVSPTPAQPSQTGVSSSEERQHDPADGPLLVLFEPHIPTEQSRLFAA